MAIQGNLSSLGIPELFSLIHQLRKTGVLSVVDAKEERGFLFYQGDLVYATSKYEARRLGNFLVRLGFVSERRHRSLGKSSMQPGSDMLFGEQLINSGKVTRSQLKDAVQAQIIDILREVLAWESGAFHFDVHDLPFPVDVDSVVSTQSVVFEVARMADEKRHAHRNLPSCTILAKDKEVSEDSLNADEQELLKLVDGRTVEQIFFTSHRSPARTGALLEELLERGVLRRSGVKVHEAVGRAVPDLRFLPCSPEICSQLLSLFNQHQSIDRQAVSDRIGRDPMLATKILRSLTLKNVELPRSDLSLQKLVDLLGEFHVRSTLMPEAVRGLFFYNDDVCWNLLWRHSWLCGCMSRNLAAVTNYPFPEQAYLAGLMHNLGAFILYNHDGVAYSQLVTKCVEEELDLAAIEEERFGMSHTRIGGIYADKWRFPRVLSLVIRHHHRAETSFPNPVLPLVNVAMGVLRSKGIRVDFHDDDEHQYEQSLRRLKLKREDAEALFESLSDRSLRQVEKAEPAAVS